MWIILCQSNDSSALWVYEGLQRRGLVPLELVTAEMLGPGLRWNHRVGPKGTSIEISFADGRILSSDSIRGVLNRLIKISSWYPLHRVKAGDRNYAGTELTAFFLSWLSCLPPPILNRPTPQGLAGRERHISEWFLLATTAGLTTVPYRQSSRAPFEVSKERLASEASPFKTVLVLDRYVFGAAPPSVLRACRRLAMLAGTTILGIEFAVGVNGQWTFASATPLPDLRLGGQSVLDALVEIFQGERREE